VVAQSAQSYKWISGNCQKEGSAFLKRRSLWDYGWRTYVDFAGRVTLTLGGLAWFVKEFFRKCSATGHKFAGKYFFYKPRMEHGMMMTAQGPIKTFPCAASKTRRRISTTIGYSHWKIRLSFSTWSCSYG
jgi:hypothetical protein